MVKKIKKDKSARLRSFDDLVVEYFKNDSEFLKLCLKGAFEDYAKDGEIVYLLKTLRQAAEAIGITQLSKETGLSRQNLYHMLSEDGNPTIKSLELVLKSFGYRLSIRKIKAK